MAPGAEPLSIEFLLQKQKEEREAAARPRFLSKEERAKIAIARRAQEIQGEKKRDEENRNNREQLEREAETIRRQERESRYATNNNSRYDDHHDRSRDRGRGTGRRDYRDRRPADDRRLGYGNVPTEPRAERVKAAANTSTSSTGGPQSVPVSNSPTPGPDSASTPTMTEEDLAALRSRYLGVDKKKRKIRKMNDRKFVFDWDEQEDTFSADPSANIGVQRQGAQVMFGRGHIAGMDDGGGRTGTKSDTQLADAMERRKAAKHGYDDRHWTDKALDEMKERDWRIFREDFSIAARGGNIPHPLRGWGESSIPKQILTVIDQIGYKEPSPIQRQAIPIGLQNRDIIGIAETGSGKTAAFVIPMLTFISNMPPFTEENRHLGPYGLVLAPTRELAQQIESEARKFATPLGFRCVSIVGGRAVEEQQFNLREGAEIIIATPGRLKDVLERHVLVLSQCRYVVMDEADRMVHLGFEADLTFILDQLPSETMEGEDQSEQMDVDGETLVKKGRTRVTTLFSATMPPPVERLARKYLKRPAIITIGEAGRAVDTVEQRVDFIIGEEKKKQRLLEILNSGQYQAPIIVFVNQKKTADMVAKDLTRAGWSAATLHSGKNQEQREASLQSLRSGAADVLVATDLAGRGIDVQDVSLVINFQMASTIEAYVHRIGRTGRAGKQGTAITFLTNDDDEVMYDLKQEISKSPVSKVPAELARHESAQHKVSREMKRKRDAEDQG
ncbi:P-loop containing nucleoside triphosphate hydrolase protein [Multifurca ochricompacta]|uniref:RNA helicase n=1 Tax=Multifurca ochricompacta TaxID=376703 RepID=A0AAD4MAD6_9AGAM|nr:P-loop containing nucleoside triphosphate hydrolase protein [Multifurca ochricompacta]